MIIAPVAQKNLEQSVVFSCLAALATLIICCIISFKAISPLTAGGRPVGLFEFYSLPLFKARWFFSHAPFGPVLAAVLPPVFALAAGIKTFFLMYKETRPEVHHEGGQLRTSAAAAKPLIKAETRRSPVDFRVAGVDFSRDRIRRSFGIFGSTGSGKTQQIWHLIHGAAQANYKMLVVDGPKGDFSTCMPVSQTNMLIVAPWHAGPAWHIAKDCPTRAHARELAKALISVSASDPLRGNAAGMIFTALLCKLQAEKGTDWAWQDVLSMIRLPIEEQRQIAEIYYPPAAQALIDAESKTTQSILINLTAFMSDVYEMALAWKNATTKFSFTDWWRGEIENPPIVILQGSGEFSSLAGGYINAIIRMISALTASPLFSDSPDRKNLIIIDELAQLPKISGLEKFLEIGRSKGCPAILATQTPSQLEKIYGKEDLTSWMSMLGTRFFGRTNGASDIQFINREIGEKTVYVPTTTVTKSAGGESITHSFTKEPQSICSAQYISELGPTPQENIRFVCVGFGADPIELQIPIFKLAKRRPPFVENPDFNSHLNINIASENQPAENKQMVLPSGDFSADPVHTDVHTEAIDERHDEPISATTDEPSDDEMMAILGFAGTDATDADDENNEDQGEQINREQGEDGLSELEKELGLQGIEK